MRGCWLAGCRVENKLLQRNNQLFTCFRWLYRSLLGFWVCGCTKARVRGRVTHLAGGMEKGINHNLTTSREWSLRFWRAGSSFGFGGGAVAGVTGGGIRLARGIAKGQTELG